MKSLSSFISESCKIQQISESFGSPIIEQIMKSVSKTTYRGKLLRMLVKWDEITDDYIEILSPEEAKKRAYKRNSYEFILWTNINNELNAWTFGNAEWTIENKSFGDQYKTWSVKRIAENSHQAYLIKDYDKFSTRELRRLRKEAQENALALKTDEEVRKENMNRFEEMKNIIRLKKDANSATLNAKLDMMLSKYDECRELIDGVGDLKQRVKYLSDLGDSFSSILHYFYNVVEPKFLPKVAPEEQRGTNARELVQDLDAFEKMLDSFIKSTDDIKTIIIKTQATE